MEKARKKLTALSDNSGIALEVLKKAKYAADSLQNYFAGNDIETQEQIQMMLCEFNTNKTVANILTDYVNELLDILEDIYGDINRLYDELSEVQPNE